MYSVPADKIAEYEKLTEDAKAEDIALGIKYNSIIYKCIDGYANNTYIQFLPDKSRIEYYKHQDERNALRKGNQKLAEWSKRSAPLRTIGRLDHLHRVAIK